MPRYRRNRWLVPGWSTGSQPGTGRIELLDARSGKVFRVRPELLGLLDQMPGPTDAATLKLDGHDAAALAELLVGMAAAGLIETEEAGTADRADTAEPIDPTDPNPFADRGEWSACELAVHTQSARGGKPNMLLEDIPPARLTHPEALAVVPLPTAATSTRTFAEVLDARRSIRDFDPAPLPLPLLGALLDRAARVTGWLGEPAWQATRRPSASGGGRHSVELYPVVRDVDGLAAGAYHYDPFEHTVALLQPWSDEHDQLQRRLLCTPMGVTEPPAVGLYLASYYRRDQCKYGGMTLSLIYRDTGCLVQTLYLAAAELGLAGCATAAMQASPTPGFLGGYRESCLHTGNFALGLPARTATHDPAFRPLDTEPTGT